MLRRDSRFHLGRFPSRNQQEGNQWGNDSHHFQHGHFEKRMTDRWKARQKPESDSADSESQPETKKSEIH